MRVALLASIAVVLAASDCYSSRVSFSVILPFTDCVRSRGKDGFYRGSIDVTESGSRCMNWTEVAGFQERHPGKGIGEHNHCRNPDSRIRPWCFFRNHKGRIDWGYCDCKQGSVRLQGGRSKLDGRVEVYLGGVWGSVCSNDWGDEDAAVVCRQLDEGISGRARAVPLFRTSKTRIHWKEVHCRGEEPDLLHCSKSTFVPAGFLCTLRTSSLLSSVPVVGDAGRVTLAPTSECMKRPQTVQLKSGAPGHFCVADILTFNSGSQTQRLSNLLQLLSEPRGKGLSKTMQQF